MSHHEQETCLYRLHRQGPAEEGQQAVWTRIGAAWTHQKGKGLNLQLEAMPLDGRVVLIEPKDDANTFEGDAK